MCCDKQVDDLIEAGWNVIDTDFDPVAFQHWRTRALACVSALLGGDDAYTKDFQGHFQVPNQDNLVVRRGILRSANHEVGGKCPDEELSLKCRRLELGPQGYPGSRERRERGKGTNGTNRFSYRPPIDRKSLSILARRRNKR